MNGYKLMAESYRKLMEQGEIPEEKAKRTMEIYNFLATCSTDDFDEMVDSSAFNDIIAAYVIMAADAAGLDKEERNKIAKQIGWIFNEMTAKEVVDRAEKIKRS